MFDFSRLLRRFLGKDKTASQAADRGRGRPMETMQGIVVTGPAQFEYRTDLKVPEPGPGEVQIKVIAAGICGTDAHIVSGDETLTSMMTPPVTIGHEFCGEIESWGAGVSGFVQGQYVTAEMHFVCGKCAACSDGKSHACQNTRNGGIHCDGAFADYVVVPASNVIALPDSIPVKVGAIMDALGNAIHTVCKSEINGRYVSLVGYGPIGAMGAEVAMFCGAAHLCIVDINKRALSRANHWAETRGLTERVTVIDAGAFDPVAAIKNVTNGGAGVSLDFSGAEEGINTAIAGTRSGGEVSLLGIPKENDIVIKNYGQEVIWQGLTLHGIIGREMYGTWRRMIQLLGNGLDVSHIVTAEYPLKEFDQAMSRFRSGEEQKVVLYPGK